MVRSDDRFSGSSDDLHSDSSNSLNHYSNKIVAKTKSGASYFIDIDKYKAVRLSDSSAPSMESDSRWFSFSNMYCFEVGDPRNMKRVEFPEIEKCLYFTLVNHPYWDWRSTTPIVDIKNVGGEQ